MKYLSIFFYLIVLILIKIGDAVILLGLGAFRFLKYTFKSLSNLKILFKYKRKKHLKKKGIIFLAHKKSLFQKINFYSNIFVFLKNLLRITFIQIISFLKKLIDTSSLTLYFLIKIPYFLLAFIFITFWKVSNSIISNLKNAGKNYKVNIFSHKKTGGEKQKKHKLIKEKRHKKTSVIYSIKLFFWGIIFSAFFIFFPLLTLIFLSDLPNPSNLSSNFIPKTTKIYDRNGELLYEIFANQNRTLVTLNQIPKHLKQATIAIEDKDFYTHPGFDLRGIIRAAYANFTSDNFQGGSTITQQLIKSALLTPDPTVKRKIKEVILAFWAERIYSKDKILEMYFNYVPYGGTAWGIQAASDVYFGKPVEDLTLSESAFLAGLPRAPSIYSPYSGNKNLWKKRQKEVLNAMVKVGYISTAQSEKAFNEELKFKGPSVSIKAPHFVMFVKNYLIEKYGISEVERGGLKVYTTLDLKLQKDVQEIVSEEVENNKHLQISNGAALVLDPRNGDILAMVGSRNYFDQEIDGNVNLTTSLRQPGSTIKIVTYSLALSSGYTEASLLDDSPITITPVSGPSYTPVNYDGKNHGRVPLRLAFANSYNITAVRVAQNLGVSSIVEFGRKLGITTWNNPEDYGVSITLGGADTTMLDLATAYATVANSGKKNTPNPILEIKDSAGNTIYKKIPEQSEVLNPGVAFIISDILADNNARQSSFGTNSPLNIPGRRVSVKTGTTDSKRDNWTVGFTPSIVVATWVGNNDNSPMSPSLASGITGAAPMWNKIITKILENKNNEPIIIPDNVVRRRCYGKDLYFLKGTERSRCTPIPTESLDKPATALAQ